MSKKVNWEKIFFSPAGVLILVLIPLIIVGAVTLTSARRSADRVQQLNAIPGDAQVKTPISYPVDDDYVWSHDRSKVVFIRDTGDRRPSEIFAEGTDVYKQIILKDVASGSEQIIIRAGLISEMNFAAPPDGFPGEHLFPWGGLIFSLDDRVIYFIAQGWVTSGAIFSYNLDTKELRFVTNGNTIDVILKGKYRGNLMVSKHKYFDEGGSYDNYFVVTPTGKELLDAGDNTVVPDKIFLTYGVSVSESYNFIASMGLDVGGWKGNRVAWLGTIAPLSQINGMKFTIVDDVHHLGQAEEYEWFWAVDDGTTHSVDEVFKKYGPTINTSRRTGAEIFLVTGTIEDNDCSWYKPGDYGQNQICNPNIALEKIELLDNAVKDILPYVQPI